MTFRSIEEKNLKDLLNEKKEMKAQISKTILFIKVCNVCKV